MWRGRGRKTEGEGYTGTGSGETGAGARETETKKKTFGKQKKGRVFAFITQSHPAIHIYAFNKYLLYIYVMPATEEQFFVLS